MSDPIINLITAPDKLLNDNPNLKKIYDRNELLINFDKIPDDIQKKIRDCINFVEINE